jgi:hypothetical protein
MDYEEFVFSMLDTEPGVFGAAIIDNSGKIAYQTENWDLTSDLDQLKSVVKEAAADGKNPGKISVMKIGYMVVEFTPERVIGTNAGRKGHVIVAPVDKGALITFIDPAKGPRDALFNVQQFAHKLKGNL